ncbi:hypothetical protein [Chryseobacterium gleum]|uniref:hypothetical protein n=1 Tax=Chryseobacterium gleum TaxID=250 RepID=UPI00241F3A68|nr:hypothetical protein [Chryseobacterium gleum]
MIESLIEDLTSNFKIIFTIIFTVIYGYTATFFLKKVQQRKVEKKNIFIETFLKGLLDKTIENKEDLLNVYSGITNLSPEDLNNRQILNKWLREILAKLVNKEVGKNFDSLKTRELKIKITNFININETSAPFSDLPDTESNILNDIFTYNKGGDNESVNRKINELSSVIITRYEQQKKIEAMNRWSIPLAIIGLILTIIFGILSLL